MTEGKLAMVSKATDTTNAVEITFGEYEKVKGAVVGIRATTAVAVKVAIATNVVTVTPASSPGSGYYDVVADCI